MMPSPPSRSTTSPSTPRARSRFALERTAATRDTYDLLRLDRDGHVLSRSQLPQPKTLPESDRGTDPASFRMKSKEIRALSDGWLRVEARGEDLVTAFQSIIDVDASVHMASGAMLLEWSKGAYAEKWTRVVDGKHFVDPPLWQYDDFRWRESPLRPLLAVADNGDVVIGRTFTQGRCLVNAATFGEFDRVFCAGEDAGSNGDARVQPFAFTTFSPSGARLGTVAFHPKQAAEYAFFDMAVRGSKIALVGTAAPADDEGRPVLYPPAAGAPASMMPFDGYVSVLDRKTGALAFERYVDRGRGDSFAAVRFVEGGVVAVGATDWDRWQGGMSVSRGGDPLLAFVSDAGEVRVRPLAIGGESRHHLLFSVDVAQGEIVAAGLGDAPLTHSSDATGDLSLMTFGGLTVRLR